jgi:hypothetical protein
MASVVARRERPPACGNHQSLDSHSVEQVLQARCQARVISAFEDNPMHLIEVKGVSKRQKENQQITVEQFKSIRGDLPELLNVLVLVDALN